MGCVLRKFRGGVRFAVCLDLSTRPVPEESVFFLNNEDFE